MTAVVSSLADRDIYILAPLKTLLQTPSRTWRRYADVWEEHWRPAVGIIGHYITRSSWFNCALRDDEAVCWVSIGYCEALAVGN